MLTCSFSILSCTAYRTFLCKLEKSMGYPCIALLNRESLSYHSILTAYFHKRTLQLVWYVIQCSSADNNFHRKVRGWQSINVVV